MGQALYRKYRTKTLSELVGQEHITETLDKAIKAGRISHAYLFTGPRGSGKTSIARILAHQINNLPYTDDSSHMDIIEIDAASNRRIDEIRELRDKVHVAPTSAKYKVYIIDEVHMLTKEAFNALLKTLEEPPAHVVFILATTDAHKLPETIISRTQRYTFKPVETSKVVAHLRKIAEQEKITVDDGALTLLAEHGEGTFRDSISLLDQARSHSDKLTVGDVQQLLGMPPKEATENLLQATASGSSTEVMTQLTRLYDQGFQAAAIAKQVASLLRQHLIDKALVLTYETTLELLTKLLEVPIAYDSNHYLEICLLQAMPADMLAPAPVVRAAQPAASATPKIQAKKEALNPTSKPAEAKVAAPQPEPAVAEPTPELTEAAEPLVEPSADDAENWQRILAAMKAKHNTLYGLIRMAHPDFSKDGELGLTFAFDFHAKRVSDPQNQQKLRAVIKDVMGKHLKLECLVDKNAAGQAPAVPTTAAKAPPEALANISNIFGGGELVE